MKFKRIIAVLAVLTIMLSSCTNKKGNESTTDPAENPRPQNGVYYEYSSGGNSDRVVASYTYENGKEIYRNEYEYWGDGSLKTITSYVDDVINDTWHYTYDEGTLSQTVRQYNEAGSECRDDYFYRPDGNISEIIWYTDGEKIGGWVYTYNENGDLSKEERFGADYFEKKETGEQDEVSPIIYTEYLFDSEGKTYRAEQFEFDSLSKYQVYEYSENDLLASVKHYTSRDVFTGEVKYEYDTEGNLTKMLTCDENGTVLSHVESLYDDSGFHYRDVFYQDGKPLYCYDYTEDGARIYSAYN